MNKKAIGVVAIIAGVVLAYWGYDQYESAGSQLSRTFGGDAPIEAWAAMIGGALCAAFGVSQVL